MHDLPERLRRAAGPLPQLDNAALARITAQRRRRTPGGWMAVAVVLLAGAAGWLAADGSTVRLIPGDGTASRPGGVESAAGPEQVTGTLEAARKGGASATEAVAAPEDAVPPAVVDPAAVAASLGDIEWQVLAVGSTSDLSVMGKVASDQEAVGRLWQRFALEGGIPELAPTKGALFLPIAGSCDSAAQVQGIGGVVSADATRVFAAVEFDPGCIRFVTDGSAEPPPRTVYVVEVPLDESKHLAGAVGIVGQVSDIESTVLAVGATPSTYVSGYVASDQTSLNQLWRMAQVQGPAPALPADQGAMILAVPGGCDRPEQVLAVDAVVETADPDVPEVLAHVYFDPQCAELLQSGAPGEQTVTLYVITVPLASAQSLRGAAAFIGCGGGALDPEDAESDGRAQCADPRKNAIDVNAAHPAVIAAQIGGDLDWEVMAVSTAHGASGVGPVATDQVGVDDLWTAATGEGPAPTLPPGRGALFVPVPGRCGQAAKVRFIDAMPNADQTQVLAVAHFDASCAEPPGGTGSTERHTVLVIGVPVEVARQVDGAVAALDAGGPGEPTP